MMWLCSFGQLSVVVSVMDHSRLMSSLYDVALLLNSLLWEVSTNVLSQTLGDLHSSQSRVLLKID